MTVKDLIKNGDLHQVQARPEKYAYPTLLRDMNDWMSKWDQWFDRQINSVWGFSPSRLVERTSNQAPLLGSFTPAINVSETENELLITAELPGMEQKDIELTVENGTLRIKGEKRQETEDKIHNYYRVERSYGTFQRNISLPTYVDEEKIDASFKNGVLTLTLPKRPELQPQSRKIEIRTEK